MGHEDAGLTAPEMTHALVRIFGHRVVELASTAAVEALPCDPSAVAEAGVRLIQIGHTLKGAGMTAYASALPVETAVALCIWATDATLFGRLLRARGIAVH